MLTEQLFRHQVGIDRALQSAHNATIRANPNLEIESDDTVVEFQTDLFQLLEDASGDPLVPAGAQGGGRACRVGDLGIGGAEDEDLDELVEDDPVRDAWAVAPKWVGVGHGWDQRGELAPEGVDDRGWKGKHECS